MTEANRAQRLDARRHARERRSNAIFWRWSSAHAYEMGWLLEASKGGLAFAWRGAVLPSEPSLIEIQTDPADMSREPREAIVRRATVVHGDLSVIAAEMTCTFPRASAQRDIAVPPEEDQTPAEQSD